MKDYQRYSLSGWREENNKNVLFFVLPLSAGLRNCLLIVKFQVNIIFQTESATTTWEFFFETYHLALFNDYSKPTDLIHSFK